MEFDDVIHNYSAGHFDRDEALHYLRTEGYPAERAEAILMRAEGTDEFDTLCALLTSTPNGLGGLTEDEAAQVDDLTASIRLAVNED
jgi:hypothetical protein